MSWLVILLVGLVAVLLSPFGMRKLYELPGLDWAELANVGQTYGAVAALLAVPTFAGVIISLLVQRREVRTGQTQTALLSQIEMARIAIDYPETLHADGTVSGRRSLAEARQQVLMNLWIGQWRSLHGLGHLTDEELRLLLARIFTRAQARVWWTHARDSYWMGVRGRRELRFFKIAESEFSRAVKSARLTSPRPSVNDGAARGSVRGPVTIGVTCAVAAAVGGISRWLISRRRTPG